MQAGDARLRTTAIETSPNRASRKRRVLLGAAAILLASLAWPVARTVRDISCLRHRHRAIPYAVARVPASGWRSLAIGMSKAEVRSLLGEPGSRSQPSSISAGVGSPAAPLVDVYETTVLECWEYTWTFHPGSGTPGFCPYAHAVAFDRDGQLHMRREPEERLSWEFWVIRSLTQTLPTE